MAPGEIHLEHFPFGDMPGSKLRPVLLLTGPMGPRPEAMVASTSTAIDPDPLDRPSHPLYGLFRFRVASSYILANPSGLRITYIFWCESSDSGPISKPSVVNPNSS